MQFGNRSSKSDEGRLLVYPNPGHDLFEIVWHSNIKKNANLILYDTQGKKIVELELTSYVRSQIDMSDFISGIYIYEVISQNRIIEAGKLIKL